MRFLLDANRPRSADNDTAEAIADLSKRFLTLKGLVARIPGHLVVLEQSRVPSPCREQPHCLEPEVCISCA